ncbi:MAG: SGNH/GDSL hydrolase family protein [Nocardioidaceae bacterium]|nr:SGNH/GDSL hydrolase family protein [Nocardioidaceae bacterium]
MRSRTMLRKGLAIATAALGLALLVPAGGAAATSGGRHDDGGRAGHEHVRAFDHYVALGDSYTAAPLVPTTLPADGCFRSTSNYPSLVGASRRVHGVVDVSCSGARTDDMLGSQQTGLGPVAPQLDAVAADTDLVTVSIGGNDEAVFGTLVGYCPTLRPLDPTGAPCRAAMNAGGSDQLLDAIGRTQQRVGTVIDEIHARAPHARVLVVGYPQLVPRRGTCPDLLPLADGDYAYGLTVNRALTQALARAARTHHAEYVDVWRASRGHDICSADPWVNGQYTDPSRAQSFHPFAVEQQAVAGLVLRQLAHGHRHHHFAHH